MSRSGNREPAPPLLHPEVWTPEEVRMVAHVRKLITTQYLQEEGLGPESKAWGVVPSGDSGSYLYMFTTMTWSVLNVVIDADSRPLEQDERSVLADCGLLPSKGQPDSEWEVGIYHDPQDRRKAWELSATIATMALSRVYRRNYGTAWPTSPKDWALFGPL